jgi:hypothetical protein
LAVSAIFEADLRALHFFQAWLYIATVAFSVRGNRWGYFIGIATALFGRPLLTAGLLAFMLCCH